MLTLLLVAAAAQPLFAQDVRYNFDKSANFAAFKTYRWVDIKGTTKLSDLVDRQVKATVEAELAKKGLAKSESETADLYVGYQAAVGTEKGTPPTTPDGDTAPDGTAAVGTAVEAA